MLPLLVMLQLKQLYFLFITHTTGGALTSGNYLKVFIDGELIASDKLKPSIFPCSQSSHIV
jgi:hypothetical protein